MQSSETRASTASDIREYSSQADTYTILHVSNINQYRQHFQAIPTPIKQHFKSKKLPKLITF